MAVAVLLLVVLATALIIATNAAEAANTRSTLVSQIEDLRSAIAQLGVDLGEAVDRVGKKIEEGGEPDPDLAADIANIKAVSSALDGLGADSSPPPPGEEIPTTPPFVPPPAEPAPEPAPAPDAPPQ